MELLLSLLALGMALLVWVRTSKLAERVLHVEQYLERSTKQDVQPSHTTSEVAKSTTVAQAQHVAPGVSVAPPQTSGVEVFFAWCTRDWLMKLGGLLVILGASWFVSYAFAEGWIGPMGRIAIGVIVGAGLMALGRYRIATYVAQGGTLLVIGAVLVVLTLYAAREVYDFFTPASALALMFATSGVLGVTSVTIKRRALAYANVLLAGVAPLLVASANPSVPGLLTYLFVLTLGALAIVWVTAWRGLVPLSLIVVALYNLPILGFSYGHDQETGLMFAYAFTALFFTTTLVALRNARETAMVDALTALGIGLFLLTAVLGAAPEEWRSMLLVGWALAFSLGAYLLFVRTRVFAHYAAYASVGALFCAVVTGLEFEGPLLTMIATAESALLVVLGHSVTKRPSVPTALSFVFLIPVSLGVAHMAAPIWRTSAFHADSAALFFLMGVLALLAWYFGRVARREPDTMYTTLTHVGAAAAGAYALFLAWRTIHALFPGDTGTTVTLVLYAAVGSLFYIGGRATGASWKRLVAGVLYAIVLGQLLLVEVWSMALSGRVITFLGIGALLMAVAWLERSAFTKHEHTV